MKFLNYIIYYTLLLILVCQPTVFASTVNIKSLFTSSYNQIESSNISYKVSIVTKRQGRVISTYKAKVNEVWNKESITKVYRFNNKQILVAYYNKSGIERFWLGTVNNLPEVKSINIDDKIFDTAIGYSSISANALWLSLPVSESYKEGFMVASSYNKNKFSNLLIRDYYFNKLMIPVRTLYYNNISNFPILEALVTKYRKLLNGYLLIGLEYKDYINKKFSKVDISDISLNTKIPTTIKALQNKIFYNIKQNYNIFNESIRSNVSVDDLKYINKKSGLNKGKNIVTNDLLKNSSNKYQNISDAKPNLTDNNLLLKDLKNSNHSFNDIEQQHTKSLGNHKAKSKNNSHKKRKKHLSSSSKASKKLSHKSKNKKESTHKKKRHKGRLRGKTSHTLKHKHTHKLRNKSPSKMPGILTNKNKSNKVISKAKSPKHLKLSKKNLDKESLKPKPKINKDKQNQKLKSNKPKDDSNSLLNELF